MLLLEGLIAEPEEFLGDKKAPVQKKKSLVSIDSPLEREKRERER